MERPWFHIQSHSVLQGGTTLFMFSYFPFDVSFTVSRKFFLYFTQKPLWLKNIQDTKKSVLWRALLWEFLRFIFHILQFCYFTKYFTFQSIWWNQEEIFSIFTLFHVSLSSHRTHTRKKCGPNTCLPCSQNWIKQKNMK